MTKYIFLDIDGVLLPCVEPYDWKQGFNRECVANLNKLLENVPEAVIIVSSDWRFDHTVDRLNNLLEEAGCIYNSPIVGITPFGHIDKDFPPDLRDREIAKFINDNDLDPEDCVALEDSWPITCCPVVMTDSKVGLTEEGSYEAYEYLTGQRPFYDVNEEVVSLSEF